MISFSYCLMVSEGDSVRQLEYSNLVHKNQYHGMESVNDD